jgi:hypothetical protein
MVMFTEAFLTTVCVLGKALCAKLMGTGTREAGRTVCVKATESSTKKSFRKCIKGCGMTTSAAGWGK